MAEDATGAVVSQAAEEASIRTSKAIEKATEINDDPKVAEVLDEAADQAEATVRRVSWVRQWIRRVLERHA